MADAMNHGRDRETADRWGTSPGSGGGPRSAEDARYRNWRHIGRGGSSDVFCVWDEQLGIDLAIKLLRGDVPQSDRSRELMRREVLVSRALRHEAICPVHDVYDGPRGFGVVMDLLQGHDLSDWMRDNAGRLLETFEARLDLLVRVADALAVAHRRIVHRDMKPSNIFLVRGDIASPLILDFGLSLLDQNAAAGLRGGTPRYMAPEQFDGFVDQRSDLFAFGVVAYELLSGGVHPLGAGAPKRPRRTDWASASIEPPSRHCPIIPAALDRLVLQLLSFDPDHRPRDARQVAEALSALRRARADAALSSDTDGVNPGAADRSGLIAVPAGEYFIGSPSTSRNNAEKPMRRIRLEGFRMSAHPVTNADYLGFVRETGASAPSLIDDAVFGAADHPVVMVSWTDAAAYARWIGGRLPTEAEWEVAAKAGARITAYPWGEETPGVEHANVDYAVGSTTAVESYPSGRNAWGFWDMAGNVWEWCRDSYLELAYRRLQDGAANPVVDDELSGERVLRGGSYESLSHACRTAFRHHAPADERRSDVGFRVVFDDE